MNTTSDIRKKIMSIRKNIPDTVAILAAVKTRMIEEARIAHEAGIKFFGHNYVQEAQAMITDAEMNVSWHMIGHLQRNKVKTAIGLFDMIESLDSLRLAKELEKRCREAGLSMDVLIEVNSGREENKTGVLPEEALELAEWLNVCEHIKLRGLMTMGPLTGNPELARPYYKEARLIFEEINRMNLNKVDMRILSMGMSNSYKVAISEGANLIRLGTSIFGPRHA